MKDKNEKIFLVLVVIGVAIVWAMNGGFSSTGSGVVQNVNPTTVVSTGDTTGNNGGSGQSASSIAYADALVKYKDARIQLNKDCQASPNNVTYKNGASIMIDNRADVARTVKVGSIYSLKAYDFKIIKLSSATLPAKFLVDCDKSQNVATILIQK